MIDIVMGAVINYFPKILKGMFQESLRNITVKEAVEWVNDCKDMWEELPDNFKKTLREIGPKLGELDWLTVNWFIAAGEKSNPAMASLFIGWPEGRDYLEKQLDNIKKQIKGETCQNQK